MRIDWLAESIGSRAQAVAAPGPRVPRGGNNDVHQQSVHSRDSFLPPLAMQLYVVLMIIAVVIGTLFETYHKGSAEFFARRRAKARAAARRPLSGAETGLLAITTVAEAAVSGEFCKWQRPASHLLMMYGFLLYVITTIVMVFAYPTAADTPPLLPALWTIGALLIVIGGCWFFFFLRVNVAHDGDSPFHLGRADLFIGALLASAVLALIWHFVQTAYQNPVANWIFGSSGNRVGDFRGI